MSASTLQAPKNIGILYLIHATGTSLYKIGFSTNTANRLKALQAASASKLVLLAERPGTVQDERKLHNKLYRFRQHGEWFKFRDDEFALRRFGKIAPINQQRIQPRKQPPVQQLADRLFGSYCKKVGITPRLLGRKRWDVAKNHVCYLVADIAIKEKRKPNVPAVEEFMMNSLVTEQLVPLDDFFLD